MLSSSSLRVSKYVLLALLFAGSQCVFSRPVVIPKQTAEHFCQLFVSDGTSVSPLSRYASQTLQPTDSLGVEQIFAGYILLADNWQSLRVFPHRESGKVSWYSASDELPSSMTAEHQKYIREVFPRLIAEARSGNWTMVDAYIDKMVQYQCQFGGTKASTSVSPMLLVSILVILLVSIVLLLRRAQKNYFTNSV